MGTTGTTWGGDQGDHRSWRPNGDLLGAMGMTRMTQGRHGDNGDVGTTGTTWGGDHGDNGDHRSWRPHGDLLGAMGMMWG